MFYAALNASIRCNSICSRKVQVILYGNNYYASMHYEKLKLRMRKSLEDRDTSGIARRPFLVNVVVFSLIACLGAFLMGFNEGYATQTLDELNTTAGSDSIKSSAIAELSAFNVS